MQQRERLGDGLKVQGPIERGVAAADDEHVAVPEILHLAHRVEDGGAFILLDAGERRTLRREGAAARGDHHHFAIENGFGVGREPEAAVPPFQALHPLIEMKLGAERLDLLHQPIGQLLAGHHGQTRNVVDRLLRIELGALSARAVENIDQMAFDVDEAELEHGEQPDRACADDDDVCGDDFVGHESLRIACRECARRDRRAHR